MITYLTLGQIDRERWDDCIAHALNGNVYAWSWYLDKVHPGWEALVEMDGDNYLSVMPLTTKKKYGFSYLCQPFFAQQLGVFSREPLDTEKVQAFLQAIPQHYALVEIRLNEANPLPEDFEGVKMHRNCILDLHDSYESLSSRYHENTKRNLKKSLNYFPSLEKGVPLAEVVSLFRADRGATITQWKGPEYARLTRVALHAIAAKDAFVYGVKNADNYHVVCGVLFFVSHHRITFLFSGNSVLGKTRQAMTYLVDQVIREYAGTDYVLDFEGSDDLNLARFYLGFGAHEVKYPSYQHYKSKFVYLCTKLKSK